MSTSIRNIILAVLKQHAWVQEWFCDGRVVCRTPKSVFTVKNLEATFCGRVETLGCTGFDKFQRIEWVALDFDVGHGPGSLHCSEEAVREALRLWEFVGRAADVRFSKSGRGIHVRVRLNEGIDGGRAVAANIARWLARHLRLHVDWAGAGHQALDFWSHIAKPRAFVPIRLCENTWNPPLIALQPARSPQRCVPHGPMSLSECKTLSRRTKLFLERGAEVGMRNTMLFAAACDMAGNGIPDHEAQTVLVCAAEACGMSANEVRRTVLSAYSKPRQPAVRRGIAWKRCP